MQSEKTNDPCRAHLESRGLTQHGRGSSSFGCGNMGPTPRRFCGGLLTQPPTCPPAISLKSSPESPVTQAGRLQRSLCAQRVCERWPRHVLKTHRAVKVVRRVEHATGTRAAFAAGGRHWSAFNIAHLIGLELQLSGGA